MMMDTVKLTETLATKGEKPHSTQLPKNQPGKKHFTINTNTNRCL